MKKCPRMTAGLVGLSALEKLRLQTGTVSVQTA